MILLVIRCSVFNKSESHTLTVFKVGVLINRNLHDFGVLLGIYVLDDYAFGTSCKHL